MADPVKILLAEDDRFLRRAAEATLKKKGYAVVTAADGQEALDAARRERPDLILLDVIMPRLHGFEVLERLKAAPETRAIPVVMLSNLGQDTDQAHALQQGAVAYLVKANVGLADLARHVADILAKVPG